MMLSDRSIIDLMGKGKLSVSDLQADSIQSNSIDMRLSNQFAVFENHKYEAIDVVNVPPDLTRMITTDRFVLHPGEMVLASTRETLTLGNSLAATFLGKSSLARVGLIVESAGLCDSGFSGQITLELANIANIPLVLTAGIKIGQLCVFKLDSPSVNMYGTKELGSHYQHQRGPTASRLGQ